MSTRRLFLRSFVAAPFAAIAPAIVADGPLKPAEFHAEAERIGWRLYAGEVKGQRTDEAVFEFTDHDYVEDASTWREMGRLWKRSGGDDFLDPLNRWLWENGYRYDWVAGEVV